MDEDSLEWYKTFPIEFNKKSIRANKTPMRLNNNQKYLIEILINR